MRRDWCVRGFCWDGDEDFIGGSLEAGLGRRWRFPNRLLVCAAR